MTTVSTTLVDFRKTMETKIRAHFPVTIVPTVVVHDGEFGVKEIDAYSKKTPAIIIAMEGSDESVKRGGSIFDNHQIDAFILARTKAEHERTEWVLIVLEHLLRILHMTPPQFGTKAPDKIRHTNLYGAELDERGLALWVVRWEQLIEIPPLTDFASLDDFETCNVVNEAAQPSDEPEDGGPVDEQTITLETLP